MGHGKPSTTLNLYTHRGHDRVSRRAARTFYEDFNSLAQQAQGSAGLKRFVQLDLGTAPSVGPQAGDIAGRQRLATD